MSNLHAAGLPALSVRACRLTFLISGLGMGAWAPLVPYARERAQIHEGQLGVLLLCLGLGSMTMMPVAAWLAARIGCRRTMLLACSVVAVSLVFLASLSSFGLLMAFLVLFGAGIGSADVTMNLQGVMVERALGRSLMPGFHGLFSLGSILSAAGISAALWLGASPLQAILCLLLAALCLLLGFQRHMLASGEGAGGPILVRPSGPVLLLGALCFIAFLVEGSMLDWSAVFLAQVRHVELSQAGLGYALFSVTMALGRLNGERVLRRLGERRLLLAGAFLAMAGMLLAVCLEHRGFALAGFVLVGAGIANMVPVFCSLAGRQTRMPAGQAIASITSIGYLGVLMGPAMVGFIAQASSLGTAFLCVASLLLPIAACAPRIVRGAA